MRPTIALVFVPLACLWPADAVSLAVTRPLAVATDREELAAVAFDRHLYAATRDGFPDLRVVAAEGQAVPYLLERHTRTSSVWVDQSQPARAVQSLMPDAEGNRIEAIVEPPRTEAAPAWIEVVTPLRDFEKTVSVYVPAPGGAWQTLSENQTVYDYSRFMDVRRCRVLLPEAPVAPRYRIVFSDVSETAASAFVELTTRSGGGQPDQETIRRVLRRRDFRIDRIDFGYRVRRERHDAPVLNEYPLHITGSEQDEKAGLTRLTLAADRLPVSELRFAIADRNVSRSVSVEVRRALDDGTYQWQRVGQGTLTRIDFHNLREESLQVALSETRAQELRVTLANRDSPPLTIEGITALCPEYRVLFLAQPGVRYALAYGSAKASAPHYDDAALRRLSALKGGEVRTLALQSMDGAAALPQEPAWARLLNSRSLQIVALGLAVAVLAWAMVRAAHRMGPGTGSTTGP